ncbi:MAG: glycoside hydrolase family 88 protein [Dehalococcoidia bacterium]
MTGTTSPIEAARRLAAIYGHRLDLPVVYTQGVGISGRLRLHALDQSSPDPAPQISELVAPHVASPESMSGENGGTANFAGVCWADELSDATGDQTYSRMLVDVANRFEVPTASEPIRPPLDRDIRVEDFFFAGTLLGRAYRLTGQAKYVDILASLLMTADTQQPGGLWWHCRASPFLWGRGNAFAAMGFAETLTYLPTEHPHREDLLARHVAHLEGLESHQDSSGMWRQVIDRPDSYLEHSATSMIGYSLARGLRMGWLGDEWRAVAEKAWDGISERIGPAGELEHVCVGTGPQPDIQSYLERSYSDGLDDRGGSMALWFAVEMAALQG